MSAQGEKVREHTKGKVGFAENSTPRPELATICIVGDYVVGVETPGYPGGDYRNIDCPDPCGKADAALIAEAFNVATETGMTPRQLLAEAKKLWSKHCEHCGSDRIYSGPPECSGCGAPICCQTCCKLQNAETARDRLAEQVRRLKEALTKIAEHGDERDEWDAVERYAQVRELAASAISTDRENGNGAQT